MAECREPGKVTRGYARLMQGTKLARGWYAVSALAALTGLVTDVISTVHATDSEFKTPLGRVANLFTYFTIDSNLLVLLTAGALALGLARATGPFRVLWLDALVGIIVTGIVYQVALAGLYHNSGLTLFADTTLHKVSPVLFVLGWLIFGPRGALSWRTIWLSTIYPLAWLAFTLIRGAFTGYYPYPFLDAGEQGYGWVTLNSVVIGLFFVALATGALFADRAFARRATRVVPEIGPEPQPETT